MRSRRYPTERRSCRWPMSKEQLTRLKADRERLGGVNLQADEDLVEVSRQLEDLVAERDDLEQGIAKLRGAIQQLNRKARRGSTKLSRSSTVISNGCSRICSAAAKRASK